MVVRHGLLYYKWISCFIWGHPKGVFVSSPFYIHSSLFYWCNHNDHAGNQFKSYPFFLSVLSRHTKRRIFSFQVGVIPKLLVWQRLRTLGTFLRNDPQYYNSNHIYHVKQWIYLKWPDCNMLDLMLDNIWVTHKVDRMIRSTDLKHYIYVLWMKWY